jgi:glycosyltransferase involved in cell wall biosynthesis
LSLTILILAKNEEHNIEDCLQSAQFADEIVVIDDFSTDQTPQIAQRFGAKVIKHSMDQNWGMQQTFAISQASCDWIFFLDADERIPPILAEEIKQVMAFGELFTYKVPRLNHFMGKEVKHCGWYPDYGIHLLPRKEVRVEGFVHPTIIHPYPVRFLKNYLIHYTYISWEQYFNKFNNYTSLAAKKMFEKGKKAHFINDIMLRPCYAFIKMYILQSGWLDGRQGIILSVFHYFYTMAKYVKLYYLQKQQPSKN